VFSIQSLLDGFAQQRYDTDNILVSLVNLVTWAKMKLTKRQKVFIENMLDVYAEIQEPIHYSWLAEKLGLSKYTAYDMLCLLEEKGYVESTYETGKTGPGRASVLFQPTQKTRETFARLSGGEAATWEEAKERVVASIAAGKFEDAELAKEILVQMNGGLDDVFYCSQVISDLVVRLRARGRHRLVDYYASIMLALLERANIRDLRLLPGFLLGLAADEQDAVELTEPLLRKIRTYEILLDRMDKAGRKRLGNMLSSIIGPLRNE